MPKITKRFVDQLKPTDRDVVLWDSEMARFGVRVKPTGAMTYVVQYRNSGGRTRKLALGRVGVLTPEEARLAARKAAYERTPEELNAARDKWEEENKDAIEAMNRRIGKIGSMGRRIYEWRKAQGLGKPSYN